MAINSADQRLGALDAAFIYLESDRAPMHVGAVNVYDGQLPFYAHRRDMDARLHLMPRYQQRLLPAPFGISHPSWEFDPDFDIRNHIHLVHIESPGTEAQLRQLAGRLFRRKLDRDKPLWEQYVVHGLARGRSAVITKVHHAMVDGVSAVDLAGLYLDPAPETAAVRKQPYRPPELPGMRERLLDAIWDDLIEEITRWTDIQNDIFKVGARLASGGASGILGQLTGLVRWLAGPMDRLPFNVHRLSGKRRVAWGSYSLAEMRAIRDELGGTLNDVVLTVLAGGIRRYMRSHGYSPYRRNVRIMAPVNLRKEEERGALGNRVSMLPIRLPLDIIDPAERHEYVTAHTRMLKEARTADGLHLLMRLLQGVPPNVQAMAGKAVQYPAVTTLLSIAANFPTVNTVCTNVPGPQVQLFTQGRPMIAAYPLAPIGPEMGVSFGFLSYNQRLYFSITADSAAMPDVSRMKRMLMDAYSALRDAAGTPRLDEVEVPLERRRKLQLPRRPRKPVPVKKPASKKRPATAKGRGPAGTPARGQAPRARTRRSVNGGGAR